jgi:hypothetical protein
LLISNGDLHFCHQSANTHRVNAADKLVSSAYATNRKVSLGASFAPGPEQKAIYLTSGYAVMSSGRLNASNLPLVNPLLDRGEADTELQSCLV